MAERKTRLREARSGGRRKVCVVTGSRAEYGLLTWLMRDIADDPALALLLVVTGAHLEPKFGDTWKAIEADGFAIDARVPIEATDDSPAGVARSMGLATIGIGEALTRLAPDVVVLLGDRYEILAAASAALIAGVPIAHLHGGELTEGVIDDAMRHAITKMAALHFVAAEPYRQRVIQMGEDPARVFTVGAPGLDNLGRLELRDRAAVADDLGLPAAAKYFVVTCHPGGGDDPAREAVAMVAALARFPDHHVVFTGVNADPGRDRVAGLLADYVAANPDRAKFHASLGQLRYLSAVKHAEAVIGNSSSGIVEAPALKVPTVNIGDRQQGRLRAPSIVDCDADPDAIAAAIAKALAPGFRESFAAMRPPYGAGGASRAIKDKLKAIDLGSLRRKRFLDMTPARAAS